MFLRWTVLAPVVILAASGQDFGVVESMLSARRYAEAIELLETYPVESPQRHFLAARALDALDQPARAAAEAQAAVDLDPSNQAYWLQLGQLFLTQNNAAAAAEIFAEALELFPSSAVLHLGAGLSLNQQRLYGQAEPHFRTCLNSDPGMGLALDGIIETFLQRLEFDNASAAAERFIEANPSQYRGYYYFAVVKDKIRAPPDEIEKLLLATLERDGQFAPAHALLGKTLLAMGRKQEAILSLEGAVRLRPDYLLGHLYLARAYRAVGRMEEAKRETAIVQELNLKSEEPVPSLRRASPQP